MTRIRGVARVGQSVSNGFGPLFPSSQETAELLSKPEVFFGCRAWVVALSDIARGERESCQESLMARSQQTISRDSDLVLPSNLRYCLFQPSMLTVYEHLSRRSTNGRRLIVDKFLDLQVPVPEKPDVQIDVADSLKRAEDAVADLHDSSRRHGRRVGRPRGRSARLRLSSTLKRMAHWSL